METLAGTIGLIFGITLFILVVPVLTSVIGAGTAIIAGFWFPTVAAWVTAHTGLQVYEAGALLGFVAGFFRSAAQSK